MGYVIKRIHGVFNGFEVGYEAGGEWHAHARVRSEDDAEALVNRLNGGNYAASRDAAREDRERRSDEAKERRRQEDAELALARERTAAAERAAATLAERERINKEAAAANQRMLEEQARQAEVERTEWLAAQRENRRRAEQEAAEQLRLFPPTGSVIVGGIEHWNGDVTFHRANGDKITVNVKTW